MLGVVSSSSGAVKASTLHDCDLHRFSWRRNLDLGDSSKSAGAHMELEEIGLVLVVECNSVELGSASFNFGRAPLLRNLVASASKESGPLVSKLKIESRRLGFGLSSLVIGLVHPNSVEVASYIFFVAKTEVLSARAGPTGSDHIGAVVSRVVHHLHVAPDRPVA